MDQRSGQTSAHYEENYVQHTKELTHTFFIANSSCIYLLTSKRVFVFLVVLSVIRRFLLALILFLIFHEASVEKLQDISHDSQTLMQSFLLTLILFLTLLEESAKIRRNLQLRSYAMTLIQLWHTHTTHTRRATHRDTTSYFGFCSLFFMKLQWKNCKTSLMTARL